MYIQQKQLENLVKSLTPNKVIVIYGARQVGKTTLLKKFIEKKNEKYLLLNGEDIFVQRSLEKQSIDQLKSFIGDYKLIIIDEAQKIRDVGTILKLMVDNIENVKIIASGSSTFDLARQVGEPLTGRKKTLKLFPLSQLELNTIESPIERLANLESRLIYGSYPEVILSNSIKDKQKYLIELVNSYLFKDILELEGLRHSNKLSKLLQLIALQIGQEVSLTEIGTAIGLSKNTVEKYLDLLEKVFIIYKLSGFSRNLRKELVKNSRYYFWDLGVRNSLIQNFNPLKLRNDDGFLWQNYIISERIKKQEYTYIFSNNYFWRTYDKQEIDLIEEKEGKLFAYEIKLSARKIVPPKAWKNTYTDSEFQTITKENYLSFIT